MANIWRKRIWDETKTFEECPSRYKADVEALMRDDVANNRSYYGKLCTPERFEELTGLPYEKE